MSTINQAPCYEQPRVAPWVHGVAGVVGGTSATVLFYPLDFIRTRLHTISEGSRVNTLTAVRHIVHEEGFRGMYRGLTFSVGVHGIGWAVYLSIFRSVGDHLDARFSLSQGSRDFMSACTAALIAGTVATPLNLLKTRRQLGDREQHQQFQKQHSAGGPSSSRLLTDLRLVIGKEGWMTFLRGWGPQMMLMSGTTVQVTLYEAIKRVLRSNSDELSSLEIGMASFLARVTSTVVFNPLEVVRTRMQDGRTCHNPDYRSCSRAVQTIWQKEGAISLFRGLPINLCRVVPTTVVAFLVYEKTLKSMRQRQPIYRGGESISGIQHTKNYGAHLARA